MDKTVYRTSGLPRHESPEPLALEEVAGTELAPLRRVESTILFQSGREVIIVHRGQEYRLRITKSDKLILTK
jgi:hemin uptake protein HemP